MRGPGISPILTTILAPVLAAALLAPCADAGSQKVKNAKAKLKEFATLEAKTLRQTNKLTLKEFDLTIDLLALQVELGSVTPDEAATEATAALAHAVGAFEARAETSQAKLEAFAAAQLQALGPAVPKAYRLGTFGAWDDALEEIHDEVARADRQLAKKLRKFGDQFESLAPKNALLLRHVAPQAPLPVAPGAGTGTPTQRPVRLHALAASSTTGAEDDGFACVRGRADPAAAGGQVTVKLSDGAATELSQLVNVATDGTFVACFPAAGPPDLAEGNWLVVVQQGGAETIAGLSVP